MVLLPNQAFALRIGHMPKRTQPDPDVLCDSTLGAKPGCPALSVHSIHQFSGLTDFSRNPRSFSGSVRSSS